MAGHTESIQISYEQLSQGKYVRNGDDLSITTHDLWGEAKTVLLKNYFETSPDLVTLKGSTLKGNIVNLLAVDSQPDTSNVAFEDPNAIGKITTADLPVIVQRADQFIELQKGDLIYLNDVIDAKDGSVGVAFKDDSSISVDPGAKMVIDDFVYDPAEPTTGSMNANIITGNFSFISGQIAKTGNDAMQVTTPVLTIGVRGTNVAGKANQDGEENEIVLLPNEDGTVGQVMITNQSGSVLLTEAFQATTIATALQPPTVPVILPKEIVLKKFAKTIATTKKTKKLRETEKEAEEAAKEKVEAEEEKEELEEEKEELEEEAEGLEEEKEQLEEEAEALEEEAEALEEEKEQIEEEAELVEQEKEQVEEKAEALEEKAEELEKKLEEVPVEEKEQIEKELEAIEEEIQEVEEIKEEIDQKVQEVEEKIQEVQEKEQIIEDKAVEIEQQVKEVEQQVQIVEEKFVQVEQQFVEIEEKIIQVEQKFEQIEQDFEQFQQEFVQEFKEFIPEEELQQFVNEAPIEIIQDVQEMIREDIKNNPEIFDQEPEVIEEEIIDEDPFQEVPEEDVILLDPEQDFDQMKEEFEQFVEENPNEVPEEIQDVFAEADNMEEFNEEMDALMQDEEFIQKLEEQMPVQDEVFNEEPVIKEEEPILVEDDLQIEQQINYDYNEDDLFIAYEGPILEIEGHNELIEDNNFIIELTPEGNNNDDLQLLVQDQQIVASPLAISSTSTVSMAENASDGATVADIDHTGGDGTVTYSITAGNGEGKFSINSSTGVITYNTQAAVLTTETFESTTEGATPTGWTGATVDATTYYGNILGRFNGDSNTGQDVYKTFDFDSSHAGKRVQIDFNFWEFGTWDAVNHGSLDQRFMVYVNDTLVVQDLRRYTGNNQQKYGETVGNLGTGWTPLPKESGMATINGQQEGELYRLYGTLDGNGDIKLGFGARLDESLSNESAAVDNIKISLTDLNYEDATSHTLTITATDASNNTDSVTQLITVTDVNEAPYFIDNVYAARTIDENGSSGTDVARVHAEDLEGDAITYSITAGNTDNKFTINSSNGLIETAGALDYETTSSYTLTVTATDEHNATGTTTITVNVGNDTSDDVPNDPATWVTAGDGSAGAYKQTIAYAGPGTDGRDYASALGHQGLDFNGAIASNFNSYDVIWYLNQSNSSFTNSVFYNDTRFTDWLNNGGVFIMHDRYVNDSQLDNNLPGHNGNVTTTRSYGGNDSSSYQIVDESTSNLLKYGPGGIMVDDTSSFGSDTAGDHSGNTWQGTFNIGGGNATNHGYMTNLDSDVLGLATNNTTTRYVDAVWEYGSGAVYYSTSPLDHYIGAAPQDNDAWDAYALNSLHYATSLIFDGYSQINGTTNEDKIYATAGDDVIYAGNSADTIWGGQGDDVFKYDATAESNSSAVDTILDFNKDEDSIDISAITSGASISRTLTGGTRFKLDIDNNGTYDMEFELSGYTGTADDVTVVT
tara:strand:+ start:27332 stop:31747 length:4416 start_codon:yes stop_codon:yes gene_type:complete